MRSSKTSHMWWGGGVGLGQFPIVFGSVSYQIRILMYPDVSCVYPVKYMYPECIYLMNLKCCSCSCSTTRVSTDLDIELDRPRHPPAHAVSLSTCLDSYSTALLDSYSTGSTGKAPIAASTAASTAARPGSTVETHGPRTGHRGDAACPRAAPAGRRHLTDSRDSQGRQL